MLILNKVAKFGGALHVYVDKGSVDGVVYIMMNSNEAAIAASKTMHGKYFDGKMTHNFGVKLQNKKIWAFWGLKGNVNVLRLALEKIRIH